VLERNAPDSLQSPGRFVSLVPRSLNNRM